MKRIIVLLIVISALSACKKEVSKLIDQDKIWTHYELFYDQNTDKTYATATFRFSTEIGTKLELSSPSTVTIDGTEMTWNADEALYESEFSGLVTTATFNWVDTDGNAFENDIEIRDIDYPVALDDTLLHSEAVNFFNWAGMTPLDSGETVRLTLIGPGETDDRVFSIDTLGATTITIDSVNLARVDSGMVTLLLDKLYSQTIQQQTSKGGLLIGKYRPTNREIYLD
ncbi:MAG: hypothetical protein ACPGU4_03765 [Flavobacteriales bacterium]